MPFFDQLLNKNEKVQKMPIYSHLRKMLAIICRLLYIYIIYKICQIAANILRFCLYIAKIVTFAFLFQF